jgi:hypothetical protein
MHFAFQWLIYCEHSICEDRHARQELVCRMIAMAVHSLGLASDQTPTRMSPSNNNNPNTNNSTMANIDPSHSDPNSASCESEGKERGCGHDWRWRDFPHWRPTVLPRV